MTIVIPPSLRCFDAHHRAIAERFRVDDRKALRQLPDLDFVFLCFTNRCGSNLLVWALASDRRLNRGRELLNEEMLRAPVDALDFAFDSVQAYVAGIARQCGRNGRFVLKISPDHLLILALSGVLHAVRERSSFVRISRNDRLSQAISSAIAQQTGQWASHLPRSGATPEYRGDEIERGLRRFERGYAMDAFFDLNRIAPIPIVYETFLAAPARHVRNIGTALGFADLRYVPAHVPMAKQAGSRNAEWRTRYLAEGRRSQPFAHEDLVSRGGSAICRDEINHSSGGVHGHFDPDDAPPDERG